MKLLNSLNLSGERMGNIARKLTVVFRADKSGRVFEC